MESSGVRGLFFSEYGLRSGWRATIFVSLVLLLTFSAAIPAQRYVSRRTGNAVALLVMELAASIAVIVATVLCARFLDRKPLSRFGLGFAGAPRRLVLGAAAGFASLSLLVGILFAGRWEHFYGFGLRGTGVIQYGLLWAAVFVFVAISEELTTRGYLLFSLTQAVGFWPAAVLLSALFAAGHLHNSGEQVIGIVAAGLLGVLLSWTVLRTGSLWWAIGFHAAWDWAETYFYGVPDSGTVAEGHLLESQASGASWISGGSVGPEGSVFILGVILLLAVTVRLLFPPTPPPDLKRLV